MAPDIELQPRYSTKEIPGRCIKCFAEEQYRDCLKELLKGGGQGRELEEMYEALVSFLTSPDLQKLRDESERYLAEGQDVTVAIRMEDGKPRYEVRTSQESEKGA